MIITIPFRGFSINNQYYSNRKFGATKDFKEWSYQVNNILNTYDFKPLRDSFNPTKDGIKVIITHFYDAFYTEKGSISLKLLDISNTEKSLLDLIIDKAHHGPAPYKSPNLNLNDSNVIELVSRKLPGEKDYVTIEILLVDLP